MTELDLIIDLHINSERQGPGSEQETLRAFELMDLPQQIPLTIADIGCGSGGQTLTLARHANVHITAVDLFEAFLDELTAKAGKLGLQDKIATQKASMEDLPFEKDFFDVIWSEGAIYNIGFEAGIKQWKEYLKTGGYLAVSEITWITGSRPREVEGFWTAEYPEIDVASNKIKILEENGYSLAGYFFLNQESWIDTYYRPLEARFPVFLERHNHSEMAKGIVEGYQKEIELYQTYKDYYSYGFYIARKNKG